MLSIYYPLILVVWCI